MQIIFQDVKKNTIKVQTQSLDDLWTLYNIIQAGDIVGAVTLRRVVLRDGDAGDKKPMYLELKVEGVEFHEFSNRLRVKGKILSGPDEFIALGQYHTINIESGTKTTIIKEQWFAHDIKRLQKSLSSGMNRVILVVAIESGSATISLVSNYSLTTVASITHNIPGKRYDKQAANEEMEDFFKETITVIIENVRKHEIQLAIVCGPGFLKENFQSDLKEECKKNKINLDIRIAAASSSEQSAISEIIKQGVLSSIVSDHKISQDTKYMEDFVERLGKNNGLYSYGMKETSEAAELGAVEHLMVTDIIMRTICATDKQGLEDLFNKVEKGAGEIHIISTMHPAGEQLDKFGGIAALLRYKIQ